MLRDMIEEYTRRSQNLIALAETSSDYLELLERALKFEQIIKMLERELNRRDDEDNLEVW